MVCVGAFFYASSMVLVRLYKDGVKNDTNLQYFYFGQIISSSLNTFMFDHKVMTKEYTFNFYILMIFSTIVAYLGQLAFTRSLFLKPAAKIMPFNYVGVIAGLLSDIFIFDKSFDILTILGAGIASSGLIYLIFKK
jgi:drug/metabolite transporter (DMT)-like permease